MVFTTIDGYYVSVFFYYLFIIEEGRFRVKLTPSQQKTCFSGDETPVNKPTEELNKVVKNNLK